MKKSDVRPDKTFTVNGIVAEYNPFHNGHRYQLEDAKRQSGADYTVVVLSGNFMQRGTPALFDKYKRAEMALRGGADLVLELPAFYSASSAEYFATGAVTLLDKLGVVDYLCFGSECGDLDTMRRIAGILLEEPAGYVAYLKQYLRQGASYPTARTAALVQFCPELSGQRDVLKSANNILGIEYLKALLRRNSAMKPVTSLRNGSQYHDRMLRAQFSSAMALRQALYDTQDPSMLSSQIPEPVYTVLRSALTQKRPLQLDDFSAPLHYKLLMEADAGYADYLDVSVELSDRIRNKLYDFTSFQAFCDLLKTKDMTYTRISRCLMHILLDMKTADMESYRQADYIGYIRVLGFRREAEELLSAAKKQAKAPILSKLADAAQILDETGLSMLQKELRISAVYESTAALKSGCPMTNEYRSPLVIL
ncbi:MAG: nucleotidyltransferase [Muribaculum sp.]|nr:nucleotidyltransferase [Muribaculum sp.]